MCFQKQKTASIGRTSGCSGEPVGDRVHHSGSLSSGVYAYGDIIPNRNRKDQRRETEFKEKLLPLSNSGNVHQNYPSSVTLLQEFLDPFLSQLQRRTPRYERTYTVSSDGNITEIRFNQGKPNNLFLFLQLLVNNISVTGGDYFSLLIPFSVHALHLPCGASPNVTETINGVYLTHILTVCSFSGRLNIIERLQHLF